MPDNRVPAGSFVNAYTLGEIAVAESYDEVAEMLELASDSEFIALRRCCSDGTAVRTMIEKQMISAVTEVPQGCEFHHVVQQPNPEPMNFDGFWSGVMGG